MLVTVLSCSKTEVESVSEANLKTSKGIANAPSESGLYVVRIPIEGGHAYTLVDSKTELVCTIGHPDIPWYCGGDYPIDIVDFQFIVAGNYEDHWIVQSQGEVLQARVYQGPFIWDNNIEEFCSFLDNATLLAEGTVSMTYRDNDWNWLFDPNYTNSFGFTAQGELLSPEGEVKHLRAGTNWLWNRDTGDFDTLVDLEQTTSIRLY